MLSEAFWSFRTVNRKNWWHLRCLSLLLSTIRVFLIARVQNTDTIVIVLNVKIRAWVIGCHVRLHLDPWHVSWCDWPLIWIKELTFQIVDFCLHLFELLALEYATRLIVLCLQTTLLYEASQLIYVRDENILPQWQKRESMNSGQYWMKLVHLVSWLSLWAQSRTLTYLFTCCQSNFATHYACSTHSSLTPFVNC